MKGVVMLYNGGDREEVTAIYEEASLTLCPTLFGEE